MPHTPPTIRRLDPAADLDAVVDLSVRAWRPVFDSMRKVLGDDIFFGLNPRGIDEQADAVRNTCTRHAQTTWVAEVPHTTSIAGFAVVVLHDDSPIGELLMLAVDPQHQRRGVGRALTDFATRRIAAGGKTVAMIGTGGDPGHAPARATYASAGYTLMPLARYFKAVGPDDTD
jgi:ribosomal protein S18 acetylase RimI-like enzyme